MPKRPDPLHRNEALQLYRSMVEIRYFEDEVQRLFLSGQVPGTTHLCNGQEAVAVGVRAGLRVGDTFTCTYRGHGHVLAAGAPIASTMAEILGRANGLCHGKGGSMHLTDVSRGALGSFAIVGAGLPIANGAAIADRYLGTGRISVAFFGDGAVNIGSFHEALNLAAVWRLPVLFVCENNLYGEYSPLALTTPITNLASRAASYAITGLQVDGNDILAVREATFEAAERARDGGGPTLIEALTYRQKGHSRSDPATYRSKLEVAEWTARDPITRFAEMLRGTWGISESDLTSVREGAEKAVLEGSAEALAGRQPTEQELAEEIYA